MVINHVIIHRLIKEQHTTGCTTQLGQRLLPPESPIVIKLVEDLLALFGRRESTATYGIFDQSSGLNFPRDFDGYHNSSQTADDFIRTTESSLESLAEKAGPQSFSTGGYLLFADYRNQNKDYLMIAMIKERPGVMINDDLEPTEQMEIDLSKLHQACKINRSQYSVYQTSDTEDQDSMSYLAFVSQKVNKDASGYFIEGLGCKSGSTAQRATKSVILGTGSFFKAKPELQDRAPQAREAVTQYLKDNIGQGPVRLESIGNVVMSFFPQTLLRSFTNSM